MKLPQIILLIGGVALATFLYFQPFAPIAKPNEAEDETIAEASYDIREDITEIKNGLDSASLAKLNNFESALSEAETTENIATLDSLVAFYDALRKPTGSAHYSKAKAELSNTADAWTEAGERFLLNAKYMGDKTRKKDWYAQSKTCFEKAVELAPNDLDIQVDLGVCMIEGSSFLGTPPMQGIGMLKSVEQKDPKNIKALINLGYFSIRSGQFEKAEARFNSVLEIDAEYEEAYLYLADLHEKQKKYDLAIADLEKYLSVTEDPARIKEVGNYIEELKLLKVDQ